VCGVVFVAVVIAGELVFTRENPVAFGLLATALLSIVFMLLLGFMDDVLALKWRYKLILPLIASLPLLVMYNGATTIVLPRFLRFLIADSQGGLTPVGQLLSVVPGVTVDELAQGAILELGPWYFVFMLLLAIFCTNAINIYAGVNGLEVGQSVVIGTAILATNLIELVNGGGLSSPHLHSAQLLAPFLGVSLGLLLFNLCPAVAFVGDTYCYFAGMTFAVAGIQGHFSKTLLLFFLPQVINFLYSLPQLFHIVPCPRHRLPWIDDATGLMVPSRYTVDKDKGVERDNMTVLCLVLRFLGPLSEQDLTRVLLALQVASCIGGMALRFLLSPYTQDVEEAAIRASQSASA
jgi:UDP-N-acetylglucosamine--dolichyl-phosphate N-acetylglucosaminephosphotransferase